MKVLASRFSSIEHSITVWKQKGSVVAVVCNKLVIPIHLPLAMTSFRYILARPKDELKNVRFSHFYSDTLTRTASGGTRIADEAIIKTNQLVRRSHGGERHSLGI